MGILSKRKSTIYKCSMQGKAEKWIKNNGLKTELLKKLFLRRVTTTVLEEIFVLPECYLERVKQSMKQSWKACSLKMGRISHSVKSVTTNQHCVAFQKT